jgi:hypothetical protein
MLVVELVLVRGSASRHTSATLSDHGPEIIRWGRFPRYRCRFPDHLSIAANQILITTHDQLNQLLKALSGFVDFYENCHSGSPNPLVQDVVEHDIR